MRIATLELTSSRWKGLLNRLPSGPRAPSGGRPRRARNREADRMRPLHKGLAHDQAVIETALCDVR